MYKSKTGLQTFKGCPLRLREISVQRNRGPTTLKGGEVSLGNAIRRRVARISKNSARHEKVKDSYGPLFGDTPVDNMYPVFRLMLGDVDNFAEMIADYPLLYQPGTTWHYSFSYDVLGYVIQEVSGIELSKYMQENVFDPLGLQDTGFYVPNEKLNRWSAAYETNQETGELSASMNPLINSQMTGEKPTLISAGGGILSTANDYAKIIEEYNRDSRSLNDQGSLIIDTVSYFHNFCDSNKNYLKDNWMGRISMGDESQCAHIK